jgi:adenine deaminase
MNLAQLQLAQKKMGQKEMGQKQLAQLQDVVFGKRHADMAIRNTTYFDVFSGRFRSGDITIAQGRIVCTDPGLKAHREIDGSALTVVPGFIDAHVHVESSLMTPQAFSSAVLGRGTTTAISDPHEIANVCGAAGIQYMLQCAHNTALDLRIMLPSCVPATHLETNGAGVLSAQDLLPFVGHSQTLGLAEMMNVPGVLSAAPEVLEKLALFPQGPWDGHAPCVRGAALSAYAMCGINSCHESNSLEEADEKLRKGLAVWMREGSVAKDLDRLMPLLHTRSAAAMGFCTDDRNPLDIAEEGHIDALVRRCLAAGYDPVAIFQAASISVARHYGLNRGPQRRGAIAPGWIADLILLNDVKSLSINSVLKSGQWAHEIPTATEAVSSFAHHSVRAHRPSPQELEGPTGTVHIIGVSPGFITTDALTGAHNAIGVNRLTVLERHGNSGHPANGYCTGFGELQGAIASSVGHDSHNLIVVGSHTAPMASAIGALIDSGGGFVVTSKDGTVLSHLALPIAGLMTNLSADAISKSLVNLKQAARSIGCVLPEPFLQLAFLSLPVIPKLKLTDKGLVDVDRFEIIDVRAS